MQISYSVSQRDLDQLVRDAAAERPGQPVRIRLQPTVYRQAADASRGQQAAWAGVSWNVECETPEEAIALRRALEAFFVGVATCGPLCVTAQLIDLTEK